MKQRNPRPCDEALLINASGDQPIDHLDDLALERHLERIFVFKLGLSNSFGIDFRQNTYTRKESDGSVKAVLFNYLSEVPPMIVGRIEQLPKRRRDVYQKLEEEAVRSFWEIYFRFQPLLHRYASQHGVDVDDLGNILGRAILLFDKTRGFKFYSYLDKTLRESIKNLRGKMYAEEYCVPLSAGRLMPQLFWLLDQETLRRERRLSPDESDQIILDFLRSHPAQFAESTMQAVALAARTRRRKVSLDNSATREGVGAGSDREQNPRTGSDQVEAEDEYQHALRNIHRAMDRAGFDEREAAIVLERLELAHDEDLYARIESELSAGSLRNRKSRLLVRFMAAFHAGHAARTGRFLHAEPEASRVILRSELDSLAADHEMSTQHFVRQLLNLMSLTGSVYRLSIHERGRLEKFLLPDGDSSTAARSLGIDGHVYNKLKAALMEQEHLGFPFLRT